MIADHFYTTSSGERDNALAFYNYISEGTACFVYSSQVQGSTPMFRLLNPQTGDHFYTISESEAANAIAFYGYSSEGVACYAFEMPVLNAVPLFRLLNQKSGDHFYTTSMDEANNAIVSYGYTTEGTACYVFPSQLPGTIPLFRLLYAAAIVVNQVKAPWAILLCKFKTDNSTPPNAAGDLPFRTLCENFFTKMNATYNVVRFFSDMSHGKIDMTDSKVLGWYTIDASQTGVNKNGDPVFDKTQSQRVALAKKAAEDDGVSIGDLTRIVLIMNTATGAAQGAFGYMEADWRRVDGRNFNGTQGARAPGALNGVEVFGQEMGHGFGLGHSRMQGISVIGCDGKTPDYTDRWDIMSTACGTFSSADNDYCAKGPGMNAWNMRSRGWLDETRVWKSNVGNDFNEVIQLRPLHQRNLSGFLAAEIPGTGSDSPYLVEFRVPEFWDAGIPNAAILVHRFSGDEENGKFYSPALIGDNSLRTHSYIMNAVNGQFSFGEGDVFEVGNGPFSRMKVLSIDPTNRVATIQLCHSTKNNITPRVKISVGLNDYCHPAFVAGGVHKFRFTIENSVFPAAYTIEWDVTGTSPVPGERKDGTSFSIQVPPPEILVEVYVKLIFDDGITVTDVYAFNSISQDEADGRNFICGIRNERLKPHPWWTWDPEKIESILPVQLHGELKHISKSLEKILETVRRFIDKSKHNE